MPNLLDKLTENLEPQKDKSKTLEEALEKALENTTPTHAGTPWENRKKWEEAER